MSTNAYTAPQEAALPTRHFAFLDGLRGLAAFYVVINHVYFIERDKSGYTQALEPWQKYLLHWLNFGEIAVAVFIVLSGYCLMLPVLRAGGEIKGGLVEFFKRRARRILPPYYAMLIISLILIALIPGMDRINCRSWDETKESNFSVMNITSHFLLFHNIKYQWKFGIVPPAWSIATEWWIYFAFALGLLPLWRRAGIAVTVALAFALTLLPHFLTLALLGRALGHEPHPWFLALFTLGMYAATITHTRAQLAANGIANAPKTRMWSTLALGFFTLFCGIAFFHGDWLASHLMVIDILAGFAATCFILYCAEASETVNLKQSPPLALRFLESKTMVWLGSFSYSLYVVHFAVLWFCHVYISRRMTSHVSLRILAVMAVGVPSALAIAWLFHKIFEKPFLKK